ncbi:MAG TPA: hypothetical protein ENN07_05465 [candidate division Zixibacteria bacterium]|nr:hypothetical protein [candidate division Zixibacteria bacterium]
MAKLSIKETLELLLKTQEIDVELANLEISKIYYPKLLEELREEVIELEKKSESMKESIIGLRKSIDEKNLELEQTREKLLKGQQRLLTVKSNKEYDAVQREIQASEESIAKLEVEIISLMEDLDRSEAEEVELREELEKKTEENSTRIEDITQQFTAIENKTKQILSRRKEYTEKIDPKILDKYQMIADGMNGFAVAKVLNRACGGCYQSLPPKLCQAIRRQDSIICCEACGRILVWDDESS